ncbi:MAG: HD domain-containing phosphohydrolase [Methylococcaceae bacterium]
MKHTIKILIIDDVLDNIQVAMNILKEGGYDFSYATSGKEGLSLLNQKNEASEIDLILLDIMMPEVDGFEVCKQIKLNSKTKDIPIIFLTAKIDVDSLSQGFALGGSDYIYKPFHAEELLARVKMHIQFYQAKKQLEQSNMVLGKQIIFQHKRLLSELEDNQKEMIWMLTELMESTSDETGKHIKRVAESSSLLARYHPTLNSVDEQTLYHASPMHDIGKMTVPYQILHKPGSYSESEFNLMKGHTTNAYNLLAGSKRALIKAAAIIAHEHHEKWNGQGYPRQLKGTDIHIYGRIVALADVFDALTHKRCYKEAWSMDKAVEYIQEHRSTQFDPELVDIFIGHVDEFKEISQLS